MQVTLEIPDTIAAQIIAAGKNPARVALEALALEGYRNRELSEGAVRRLLGFDTGLEVHDFLANHNVPLNYSFADWQHDKQVADQSGIHTEQLATQ